MPEGDTVWLTAQRLHKALAGRILTRFDLRVPDLATVELRGATVTEVLPRGKHLLIRLDTAATLHSHLRMDGSWYLNRAGERPRGHPDHMIRAQLGNAEWLATGYRVHDLRLLATSDEAAVVGHLGPDLLGPDWDLDEAVRRVRAHPDRAIGEALLDQRNLAGIGNLYKCEALFVERTDPWAAVAAVADLPRLVSTTRRLMLANREHPEQSTTGLLARGRQHWVYDRAGEACRRCGTAIRRADQGTPPRQRSTYWCADCQPSRPARPAASRSAAART
ncbi:MAG: Endonuclease-8 [Pseudonocardiales bacterium]|nr:Endonuclease-8 [Pseudonocardiales bacterium]